jgi:hypothetical protein
VIRKDGNIIQTLSSASGNFDFNGLGLGTYDISVSATDNDTDWVGDQLSNLGTRSVSVSDDDDTMPTILLGGSEGNETDAQNQMFTWNVTDASGLSSVLVTITQDGNVVQSFNSASGSFDFNSLGLAFEINVSATDGTTTALTTPPAPPRSVTVMTTT